MNDTTPAFGRPPLSNRDALLASALVSLADTLVDDYDVVELLDRLIQTVVDLLGVDAAGLMLVDQRGSLRLLASSSEQIRLLEILQLQSDEGPCLECVSTGLPVTADDITTEGGRWPRFSEAADSAGFRSVLALPMRLRDETIGGLNLFSRRSPALSQEERPIAQALADVATIGILQQRSIHRASLLAEQLQSALSTRVLIEQAKGVMAAHGELTMDQAFAALRNFARSHNIKLSDLAEEIVTGRRPARDVLGSAATPGA